MCVRERETEGEDTEGQSKETKIDGGRRRKREGERGGWRERVRNRGREKRLALCSPSAL